MRAGLGFGWGFSWAKGWYPGCCSSGTFRVGLELLVLGVWLL